MDAVGPGNLLAQQAEPLVGEAGRIQRVASHEGMRGGVRAHAGVGDATFAAAQPRLVRHVHEVGVHHDCGIHRVEGAGAGHELLAGFGLLGGSAVVEYPPAEGIRGSRERIRQGEERSEAGGGDNIVATAVPDAR